MEEYFMFMDRNNWYVKMFILFKVIYRFNVIFIKLLMIVFIELEKNYFKVYMELKKSSYC